MEGEDGVKAALLLLKSFGPELAHTTTTTHVSFGKN